MFYVPVAVTIGALLVTFTGTAHSVQSTTAEQCLRRGQLALMSAGTVVQAVSEFHCALLGPPELAADAHRGLASAYAELGERAKATAHLEACLRIEPSGCDRMDIERRLRRGTPAGEPASGAAR